MCRLPPPEHTVLNTDALMLHFRYLDRRWKVTLNAAQVGQSLQLDLAMGPKARIKWRGLPNKGWLKSLLSYIWNAQSG